MSIAREWPNNAALARDEAAELMQATARLLRPIVEEQPLPAEAQYRRVAQAYASSLNAVRWLESVGARTRPVE